MYFEVSLRLSPLGTQWLTPWSRAEDRQTDGGCASPPARQPLAGVSVHRSRLEIAQRKKNHTLDVGSSALTYFLQVQLPPCCANVDVARSVHPESAHFIALKVSAVHFRRCEILNPVESFVLVACVKLY